MKELLKIIDELRFDTIDELFIKKTFVRDKYLELDTNIQELYKWYYYYQLCILRNPLKDLMWDYINGFCVLDKLNEEYIEFCNKRDKLRHKNKIFDEID